MFAQCSADTLCFLSLAISFHFHINSHSCYHLLSPHCNHSIILHFYIISTSVSLSLSLYMLFCPQSWLVCYKYKQFSRSPDSHSFEWLLLLTLSSTQSHQLITSWSYLVTVESCKPFSISTSSCAYLPSSCLSCCTLIPIVFDNRWFYQSIDFKIPWCPHSHPYLA